MSSVPPHREIREAGTLAQQLSGAFTLFGALVIGAFVVTATMYAVTWFWVTPELQRSYFAAQNESAAHSAMVDQENGLRGYLLTRDAKFLEPYLRGKASLVKINRELTANVGAMPSGELATAMVRTQLAQERWQERWANPVTTGSGGVVPPITEGKALFDAYRKEQVAFAEALDRRRDDLHRRNQNVTTARVALELAVFLSVLFIALRQHHMLRAAIVEPVAALLRHIRRIRDGQLEATADPVGPRELAELAQGLNEMVRALSAARKLAGMRDDALREHSARLRQILEASREFSESLNLKYVVDSVRESAAAVGGYQRVIVWLMDDEQKRLVETDGAVIPDASSSVHDVRSVAARAAKSGRITFEAPNGQVRFGDDSAGPTVALAIPLIVGARVVGVLEARRVEPQLATREVVEVLEMLATHAATAIESARLHEVVEERSQVDPLTHLLNRRRLDEDLDTECKRSVRYGRPLALVMLDVDHFKAFNDSHGHPRADVALQEVATVIAGCVRTTDTAYRYGGEEFCVILRETTGSDAMLFAERVRQRIEHRFASGELPGITASFGVADFAADSPTPRALVEAADAAMYASKHAGRNRVMLSSRPPPSVAEAEASH